MLIEITYYEILGKPLIMYLGIITLLCFFFTASISVAFKKNIKFVPFKWHPIMAKISLTLACLHGLLGVLAFI
ncbi:hypothetical protein KKF29_02890 [Patescibacteria group bacterium]|nr:hypothetical protein [Patescibacteria group bacterium]